MTLINKIVGTMATTYLVSMLTCGILASHLTNNFDYSQKRENGQVVKVKNRREKEFIVPKKVTISYGKSFVSGRDSDNNGNLDEIILNIKSKEAQTSLLPLATQERITQIYREVTESRRYKEKIKGRQELGGSLFSYAILSLLFALPISSIYKYSTATPEQLSEPFFHCR